MSEFRVTDVIDGDTFDVKGWEWNGQKGQRVRPTGYDAPELGSYQGQQAKQKLARLILSKNVEIRNAHKIDRGRLVCDVYFKGRYLASYFPEYQ